MKLMKLITIALLLTLSAVAEESDCKYQTESEITLDVTKFSSLFNEVQKGNKSPHIKEALEALCTPKD